jgi:hypothetical protein
MVVVGMEDRQGLFSLETRARVKSTKASPHLLIPLLYARMPAHLDFHAVFSHFPNHPAPH